jgi:hypothetical protein
MNMTAFHLKESAVITLLLGEEQEACLKISLYILLHKMENDTSTSFSVLYTIKELFQLTKCMTAVCIR